MSRRELASTEVWAKDFATGLLLAEFALHKALQDLPAALVGVVAGFRVPPQGQLCGFLPPSALVVVDERSTWRGCLAAFEGRHGVSSSGGKHARRA